MGRNRIVAPGSDRIEISDGDWIEIKRILNTGDTRKLEAAGLKPPIMVGDKIISPVDWAVYELERALVYLTKWSLCGPGPEGKEGEVLPLTFDSMKALDVDSFNEVNRAILKYVADKGKAANPPIPTGTEKTPTPSNVTSGSETTSL